MHLAKGRSDLRRTQIRRGIRSGVAGVNLMWGLKEGVGGGVGMGGGHVLGGLEPWQHGLLHGLLYVLKHFQVHPIAS